MLMADGIANFFHVGCDRCYCHQLFVNHLMLLADVICHVIVIWPMIFAIVADGKPHFEIIDDVVTVADGKATM